MKRATLLFLIMMTYNLYLFSKNNISMQSENNSLYAKVRIIDCWGFQFENHLFIYLAEFNGKTIVIQPSNEISLYNTFNNNYNTTSLNIFVDPNIEHAAKLKYRSLIETDKSKQSNCVQIGKEYIFLLQKSKLRPEGLDLNKFTDKTAQEIKSCKDQIYKALNLVNDTIFPIGQK